MMFHQHPDFPAPGQNNPQEFRRPWFGHHHTPGHLAAHIGMAIVMGSALVLGFGYAVMMLWNGVMPALLSVGHLSYWHSVGLLILARILVGGFHGRGHGGRHRNMHGSPRHQYENWWHEVGEQSFRDFAARTPER